MLNSSPQDRLDEIETMEQQLPLHDVPVDPALFAADHNENRKQGSDHSQMQGTNHIDIRSTKGNNQIDPSLLDAANASSTLHGESGIDPALP